jgi:putative spermidine/putrescine transport system substrate-binding protein
MTDRTAAQSQPGLTTRRVFFQKAMVAASVMAGAGLLTGFPLVWAQRLKEVTLLQVGGSYSAIIDIARQATKDLGFKIEMQNAATDALVNRVATQPKSLDIADLEYWMISKLLSRQQFPLSLQAQ